VTVVLKLNAEKIQQYMTNRWLSVDPFEPENLFNSHYRFRLGAYFRKFDPIEGRYFVGDLRGKDDRLLLIPPRSYVVIQSLERFALCSGVSAQFSQVRKLPLKKRLNISQSFTVDEGFDGFLVLSVQNGSDLPASLMFGEVIGKIVFFDTSEVGPLSHVRGLTPAEFDEDERMALRSAEIDPDILDDAHWSL
jgi:deoxycytidine triphosphate deaminase